MALFPESPVASPTAARGARPGASSRPHRFDFARDTFAFANELIWEYSFDAATAKTTFRRRVPAPRYAHRCFVLTRAARQFLYHARFEAGRAKADAATYRQLIRAVVSRNPRVPSAPGREVIFPGYASLREFSQAHEVNLKAACGGAWRSYVLRSHWRMVFPISRVHQARTAGRLHEAIRQGGSPIVHLVRFPSLTINHGMVLFDAAETDETISFQAYDPNDPAKPTSLTFDRVARCFRLPANRYWAGGPLNVIEIYRSWLL